MSGSLMWSTCPQLPFETPKAMSLDEIVATQDDFVRAARNAMGAGCDGVEIHAGNG
jgi:N-ethylmaleimide reductase